MGDGSTENILKYVNKNIKNHGLSCKVFMDQFIFYEGRAPVLVLFVLKSRNLIDIDNCNNRAISHKRNFPSIRVGAVLMGALSFAPSIIRRGRHLDFFATISEMSTSKIGEKIAEIVIDEI